MTDTNSIEPKPCPFCGKTNAKRHCDHTSGWIGCECGASGPRIKLDVDRYPGDSFRPNEEQKVVSAWSRRALSASASAGEGERVWKLVGTEKRPIEQEYEVGVMPKVPKPIEWETLYLWEAKVAAITKNGKPPVASAGEGELRWVVDGRVFGKPTGPDALEYADKNWHADSWSDTRIARLKNIHAAPQPATGEEEKE